MVSYLSTLFQQRNEVLRLYIICVVRVNDRVLSRSIYCFPFTDPEDTPNQYRSLPTPSISFEPTMRIRGGGEDIRTIESQI
jgi:hypothetical protein